MMLYQGVPRQSYRDLRDHSYKPKRLAGRGMTAQLEQHEGDGVENHVLRDRGGGLIDTHS
jgi:hypothetical protein